MWNPNRKNRGTRKVKYLKDTDIENREERDASGVKRTISWRLTMSSRFSERGVTESVVDEGEGFGRGLKRWWLSERNWTLCSTKSRTNAGARTRRPWGEGERIMGEGECAQPRASPVESQKPKSESRSSEWDSWW